jgi:hypothetical protein
MWTVPIPNVANIHMPACFGLVSIADHMPIHVHRKWLSYVARTGLGRTALPVCGQRRAAGAHCHLLSVADHCLRSENYINVIVSDKQLHCST